MTSRGMRGCKSRRWGLGWSREAKCDGGGGGKVLIFRVGKKEADIWVLQCEGHACRAMGHKGAQRTLLATTCSFLRTPYIADLSLDLVRRTNQ